MGCLEDAKILWQGDYKIEGMWTASQTGIIGNEQADKLAKNGGNNPPCPWTRTTLLWIRNRPHYECFGKGRNTYQLPKKPQMLPFKPMAELPRRTTQAISRLRAQLTVVDRSPTRPAFTRECGGSIVSSRQILLDCMNEPALSTRKILLHEYEGNVTWDSITNTNIPVKRLMRFMTTTELL